MREKEFQLLIFFLPSLTKYGLKIDKNILYPKFVEKASLGKNLSVMYVIIVRFHINEYCASR